MTENWRPFEEFLADSFREGQVCRELRLSAGELGYLRRLYPQALCAPTSSSAEHQCKRWYAISLRPCNGQPGG